MRGLQRVVDPSRRSRRSWLPSEPVPGRKTKVEWCVGPVNAILPHRGHGRAAKTTRSQTRTESLEVTFQSRKLIAVVTTIAAMAAFPAASPAAQKGKDQPTAQKDKNRGHGTDDAVPAVTAPAGSEAELNDMPAAEAEVNDTPAAEAEVNDTPDPKSKLNNSTHTD